MSKDAILEDFERGLDAADARAGADRSALTFEAQQAAQEVVVKTGVAAEADEVAAEAFRISVLAERTGDRDKTKKARRRLREARRQAKAQHRDATKTARRAYDAVRFTDPSNLGFLLVVELVLALNIMGTVLLLATYIKGSYTLGIEESLDLLNVMLDGVTLWLIMKRKSLTRPWVIGLSIFNIVVGTTFNLVMGNFDPISQSVLTVCDAFMLLYFLFSKRVKATLVEPFNRRSLNDDLDEEESFFRPRSWEFWRNLIFYFIIFSIIGHWMEAAVCLLIKYGIVPGTYDPTSQIWSDWLYPFPVYGIGFCACAIMLYPLKNFLQRKIGRQLPALLLSFIANALTCTAIELVLGLATNQDLQLWDYSDMFCNFMGQVCLQNSLFFGFVATVMTWVVYPALERLFRRIPNEAVNGIFVVAIVGCVMLYALYYFNLSKDGLRLASEVEQTQTSSSAGSHAATAALEGALLPLTMS